MLIKPLRTGKAEFLSIYTKAIDEATAVEKQDLSRLYNLRCSQLPYCPTSVLLNYAQRGTYQSIDLMMAFYVGVGHAVHHVLQKYLAQSGTLLANYKCHECDTVHEFSFTHECCGFPTEYDEIGLNYKGIRGHIDALFRDRQGRYWIVDFKTTALEASAKKEKDPPFNYVRQVTAYAYLLWKQHEIKVEGCMLVFIPRDNPKKPTVWEYRMNDAAYEKSRQLLLADKKLHQRTMVAETLEEMLALTAHKCVDEYCKYCKKPTDELTRLVKQAAQSGRFPIQQLGQNGK